MKLGLRIGAVTCVAAIVLVWWPSAATAAGEAEVGWWYRLTGGAPEASSSSEAATATRAQAPPPTLPPAPAPFPTVPIPEDTDTPGVPAPVPPPATVPEGGMYIANDTLGPSAIGAVRFAVGQVGETRLTLQFAEGGASAGLIPIVACPLLEGFQAVANGAWRDRPAHDCARAQTLGTVNADGTITFVLSAAFQQAGQETLDVVILPEPTNGTPFSVAIDTVSADALAVTGAAPERPLPSAQPAFAPDPEAPAASYNSSAAPAASSGSVRATPGVPATVPPASGAPAPTAAPGESSAVQPVAELFDDRPWARWVATAILGALALGMAAASTRRPSGDSDKGVGRFARHREGMPPALT